MSANPSRVYDPDEVRRCRICQRLVYDGTRHDDLCPPRTRPKLQKKPQEEKKPTEVWPRPFYTTGQVFFFGSTEEEPMGVSKMVR